MKLYCKHTVWLLLAAVAWVATASAQETKATPEPEKTLKIEGEITSVFIPGTPGPPSLTVKDKDRKEYIVHFGPLAPLRGQGFNPKVGETITVSGTSCCEMDNKLMVHSKEITLAGKTFRTPMTPAQMMRMQPGAQAGCCQQGEGGSCPGCAQNMPHDAGHCPHCPQHEMSH